MRISDWSSDVCSSDLPAVVDRDDVIPEGGVLEKCPRHRVAELHLIGDQMRFGGCHGGDPFPYASLNWRRYQRRCALSALVIDHPLDNFFAQTALPRSYGVRCAAAAPSSDAVAASAPART